MDPSQPPQPFTPTQGNHRAAIALGSNLGNSCAIVETALKILAATPGIILERQSHLYRTAPVGPPQPDYINACAVVSTTLESHTLLTTLLTIEQQFGRVRLERWGPRLLDLDLLLYDDQILDTPSLQLPHPRMHERAFVLVPLAEIAPSWVHPLMGEAIGHLVQQVDVAGVEFLE